MSAIRLVLIPALMILISGCASSTFKARQDQRDQLALTTGMYCEFISADLFPDVDVELSLRMAKRCDAEKNFTITNHRNESGHNGVIYCCSMANVSNARARKAAARPPAPMTPVAAPAAAPKETKPANKEIAQPAHDDGDSDDLSK